MSWPGFCGAVPFTSAQLRCLVPLQRASFHGGGSRIRRRDTCVVNRSLRPYHPGLEGLGLYPSWGLPGVKVTKSLD